MYIQLYKKYLYGNLRSSPRVVELPSEPNSLARLNPQLVGVPSKLNSLALESSTRWSPQQVEFACVRVLRSNKSPLPLVLALYEGQGSLLTLVLIQLQSMYIIAHLCLHT